MNEICVDFIFALVYPMF